MLCSEPVCPKIHSEIVCYLCYKRAKEFDLCLTDSKPRRTVKKTIELTTIEQNKLPTGYCETCEDLQISRNQRKNNIKTVCEYHPLGELSFLCKKHTYRICKKHVDTNLQLQPIPTNIGPSGATRRTSQSSEIVASSPDELREMASSKFAKISLPNFEIRKGGRGVNGTFDFDKARKIKFLIIIHYLTFVNISIFNFGNYSSFFFKKVIELCHFSKQFADQLRFCDHFG